MTNVLCQVLRLIQERPNICKQLHLPAQSGSDRVLASMGRGYTCSAYVDLVHHIRSIISGNIFIWYTWKHQEIQFHWERYFKDIVFYVHWSGLACKKLYSIYTIKVILYFFCLLNISKFVFSPSTCPQMSPCLVILLLAFVGKQTRTIKTLCHSSVMSNTTLPSVSHIVCGRYSILTILFLGEGNLLMLDTGLAVI